MNKGVATLGFILEDLATPETHPGDLLAQQGRAK